MTRPVMLWWEISLFCLMINTGLWCYRSLHAFEITVQTKGSLDRWHEVMNPV